VNHGDPALQRLTGAGKSYLIAVEKNLSGIRSRHPRQNVHQGRFPRSILPNNSVKLPRIYVQMHVVQGHYAGKRFGDSFDFKDNAV
jgi:hypothetical protein